MPHHVARGDLIAKPDVRRFTPTGVVFTDGTEAAVDLSLRSIHSPRPARQDPRDHDLVADNSGSS